MAQTQCLQCSGTFDDSAQFCPGCGFSVPSQIAAGSPEETYTEPVATMWRVKSAVEDDTEAFAKRWVVIITGCVALLIVGCYLTRGMSGPVSPEWTPQNLATLRKLEAKEQVREIAKNAYDLQTFYNEVAREYLKIDTRRSAEEGR